MVFRAPPLPSPACATAASVQWVASPVARKARCPQNCAPEDSHADAEATEIDEFRVIDISQIGYIKLLFDGTKMVEKVERS